MKHLIAKVLAATGLCRLFTFYTNGFRLRFYPTSLTQELWVNPTRRGWQTRFIRSMLTEGDIYIDVGANIGSTVVPAAQCVGRNGRVLAFEAHPTVRSYLQGNIALNECHNVTVCHAALGETKRQCAITSKRDDDTNQITGFSEHVIEMDTLDSFTREYARIALLKIDVEGYEKMVLLGGKETLAKTDCLYIEFSNAACQAFGYHVRELRDMILAAGFTLYQPGERNMSPLNEITDDTFCDVVAFQDPERAAKWERDMAEVFRIASQYPKM